MLPPTSRCRAVATTGLIGRGGMTLLSLAQSIVNYGVDYGTPMNLYEFKFSPETDRL
jgi:hypothetical protein